MVNCCIPSTCRGGCYKDLSCIVIDGRVFRFAACQFGQQTVGSPLGSIVCAIARFFARLTDPVHVAAWVDDLIFIMSTQEHGDGAGFEGGCEVCAEYHVRALKVQEMWQEKTLLHNIQLSAKGHPVGQLGVFTGVAIDTYRGRFNMLQEKLESPPQSCLHSCAFPASGGRRSTMAAQFRLSPSPRSSCRSSSPKTLLFWTWSGAMCQRQGTV